MAFNLSHWVATAVDIAVSVAVRLVIIVFVAGITLVVCLAVPFIIFVGTTNVTAWWRSPWMRLLRLGGVTTLKRSLSEGDPCTMCQARMEAGEKVRTLSCDHVFHCGGIDKCQHGIDYWLLSKAVMSCPICRQIPHPVLPWKRPPASSRAAPAPATSEEQSPRTRTWDSEEEEWLIPTHWFDDPPQ